MQCASNKIALLHHVWFVMLNAAHSQIKSPFSASSPATQLPLPSQPQNSFGLRLKTCAQGTAILTLLHPPSSCPPNPPLRRPLLLHRNHRNTVTPFPKTHPPHVLLHSVPQRHGPQSGWLRLGILSSISRQKFHTPPPAAALQMAGL